MPLYALIGFIGCGSDAEDAGMALNVMLDKDGSVHTIRQNSYLFSISFQRLNSAGIKKKYLRQINYDLGFRNE